MSAHYFDFNATTFVDSRVLEALIPYFREHFGNPSSLHQMSRIPARALRTARRQVQALLGAGEEREILFTSGGTESNNTAIRSALASSPNRRHMVTSAVEHSSVLKLARQLEKEGVTVSYAGVDGEGRLDFEQLKAAVTDQTALVSLMLANNETGVLFPIREAAGFLKGKGILFHVDAVQAVGKHLVSVQELGVDFLSLSAHKFYGPKGVGALYVRSGVPFHPLIWGGSQERGRRAGTENLPAIAGLGAACEQAFENLEEEISRLKRLRDFFESEISSRVTGVTINGGGAQRLCNTSNITFEEVEAETLIIALDQKGICVSSGSACLSGAHEPSHVLKAMGRTDAEAKSCVRFSFGKPTTEKDVEMLLGSVAEAVRQIRAKRAVLLDQK